jgi:hypothetical protein
VPQGRGRGADPWSARDALVPRSSRRQALASTRASAPQFAQTFRLWEEYAALGFSRRRRRSMIHAGGHPALAAFQIGFVLQDRQRLRKLALFSHHARGGCGTGWVSKLALF